MTHRSVSSVHATFRNELRLLLRDPFCLAVLLCFSLGLAWASWSSYSDWRGLAIQQTRLQDAARESWLSQSTANAHMATHVGQNVYKPISPLAGFDPGSVADFGSTMFLQSHHQSAATGSFRQNKIDLLQNETYSPAVLLELIGPLLIIVLGTASIAREKRGGTLSILFTTGAPWSMVLAGKALAILCTLAIVASPALLLLVMPWIEGDSCFRSLDLFWREVIMLLTLTAYFVGWLGLTFLISSKSQSMTGSFSLLIALWSVFGLVVPRIAGDVATFVSPLPTNAEIRVEKEDAVRDANQSSMEMAKARKALESRLLAEFKVDRIEDLPIDLAGAQMIEHEANANRLYDQVDDQVTQAKRRQNELIGGFQFISPYLAMRAVSMSFAATDRTHHYDFVTDAEDYRRQFVEDLNTAEMNKQGPGNSAGERREFWARVAEFQPKFVSPFVDAGRCMTGLICIAVWAVVVAFVSLYAAPPINRL